MTKKFTNKTIPGFHIIGKLGQGGMGTVFKAVQKTLEREVALKIMPAQLVEKPEFKQRFFREAKAAGKLNHPNIVQGIDAGEADGYCWIAMELVDGPSVTQYLKSKGGKLSRDESLSIVSQISHALEHASAAGIVHRDVKPENFLITNDGTAKLCDLGISKIETDTELTQTGHAIGTPHFISPEQARGLHDIDSRADTYSLGASWYYLLSGETPFNGATAAVIMTKHITEKPEPIKSKVKDLDGNTAHVLEKMMERDRAKRYQNFKDLIEDLESLKKHTYPRHAGPPKSSHSARVDSGSHSRVKIAEKNKKNNSMFFIGGGGIVLLIALAIFFMNNSDDNKNKKIPATAIKSKSKNKVITKNKLPKKNKPLNKHKSKFKTDPIKTNKKILEVIDEREPSNNPAIRLNQLKMEVKELPAVAKIETMKQFVEEFKGTKEAGIVMLKLKEIESKMRQLEAQAFEKDAKNASNELPPLKNKRDIFVYKRYLMMFKGTNAAIAIQKKLDDFIYENDIRSEYAKIPHDEEEALAALRAFIAEDKLSIKNIIPFAKHKRSKVRILAINTLKRINVQYYVNESIRALTDKNERVRLSAVDNLKPYAGSSKVKNILLRVAENDSSPLVRKYVKNIIDGK